MQISPIALFCLGLIVLCIGYIFVEVLRWEKYFFRKIMERNNKYRLDRIIHYILRWIIINIVFIYMTVFSSAIHKMANLLNNAWILSKWIWTSPESIFNIQIISFSIWYFFVLLAVMLVIFRIIKRILCIYKDKKNKK